MTSSSIHVPLPLPLSTSVFTFILFCTVTLVSPSHQYQSTYDHTSDINKEVYSNNNKFHHQNNIAGGDKPSPVLDAKIDQWGRPIRKPKNLTCHVCHSESSSECLNFSSLSIPADFSSELDEGGSHLHNWDSSSGNFIGFPQECKNESYICSVRKFGFTMSNSSGHSPMRTFALKRNCTLREKCEPGCVVMGERTRIYVCSTCCSSPLCNIGNGADKLGNNVGFTKIGLILIMLYGSVSQFQHSFDSL